MEYMFLITVDESQATPADPTADGFEDLMGAWFAYNQMLVDGGHFITGASLRPSTTATVANLATGTVTDGPYVETKEQVGGFYLVEARDLDEAIMLAQKMPVPAAVEVRPVMYRPGA
ncbi:YciI family protein [Nocardioides sp. CN2-186]|uniref:YciI family protein n=1 Tax=Nocardioides tweenelious TaxID=3156607 RepID=UPI0032B524EE